VDEGALGSKVGLVQQFAGERVVGGMVDADVAAGQVGQAAQGFGE